jgi:hypothetical protein
MSKPIYTNHDLNQYILGALPEAEAESFDELCFAEEEFVDALNAAEKDLVDAYVQGDLADQELERFKSYYLASPLRREKVNFAQAFKVMTDRKAVAPVEVEAAAKSPTRRTASGWFSALNVFAVGHPALQSAFVAVALVLMIAAGWLVFDNVRLRHQVTQTQTSRDELLHREQELQNQIKGQQSASSATEQELARLRDEQNRLEQELAKQREQQNISEQHQPLLGGPGVASFILAPQLRGPGQIQTISVPAKTDSVAMQLELEPNAYSLFSVSLLDQSGNKTLWRSSKLKAKVAANSKSLTLGFRAAILKPQTYVLRVSGISAKGVTEIVGDYPFRVVKSDNPH